MKRSKGVEIEKYQVTNDAYILLEHELNSDAFFATVVSPENDFSVPLYSFNNASSFYLRYNSAHRFRVFDDAVNYIENTEDVQNELKSLLPDYGASEDESSPDADDKDGDFPLEDLVKFDARLLTSNWTEEELKEITDQVKQKTVDMIDEIVGDEFMKKGKKLGHSVKTEYFRLMFIYTTFNGTLDEDAKSDIDSVLSLMYEKKVKIQGSKNQDIVYKRIKEFLEVYDDIFSEKNNAFTAMTYWVTDSIYYVLRLYHVI